MMNSRSLKGAMENISALMDKYRDYLVELDAQNGDGDLGISMSVGYRAVSEYLRQTDETDLGKLFMKGALVFNEAAPSSLGTITAFGMMGMAKTLKGKQEASLSELAEAMAAGIAAIMEKAKSKPGEKTILDALYPAVTILKEMADKDAKTAFAAASQAAAVGAESTRKMQSVHGRGSYYGEKSLGVLDGGAVVGKLIFEGIARYCS